MTGYIIINGFKVVSAVDNQVKRLLEEFSKRDVDVKVVKNDGTLVSIMGQKVSSTLEPRDFIVFLDKDRYTARMLEKLGYRLFNKPSALELCDDKMLTHIALANNGIKMPKTFASPLKFFESDDYEYLYKVEKELGYPLIVKENYGSLGKQVYLINNHEELASIDRKLDKVAHVFQEFISSSRGLDYRLIIINHKVVAYMKRENKHSYLSNLASGGTSSIVKLPQEYLDMAIKASEVLDLDYCGVDILKGKDNEPILSEVNSNAFFEGIEKTTNINVASIYVNHILETIKNEKNN